MEPVPQGEASPTSTTPPDSDVENVKDLRSGPSGVGNPPQPPHPFVAIYVATSKEQDSSDDDDEEEDFDVDPDLDNEDHHRRVLDNRKFITPPRK